MAEVLLALAYPLVVAASGLLAGAQCLWRRHRARRGHPDPHIYPGSGRHRADLATRTARDEAVAEHAARVIEAELARIGDLYETPMNSARPR